MPHISRIMRAGMSISGDRGTVGNSKKRRLRRKHAMVSVASDSTRVFPVVSVALDRGTVGNSKKWRLRGKYATQCLLMLTVVCAMCATQCLLTG
jgi:hypothetical protein